MSFIKRIRDLTAANVNDLLDKAEDPVKMLNQFLRDLEQDIAEAEVAVAKQIAIEKKLKQQYEESSELANKREQQAIKALESGNEDLARKALIEKKANQEKAAEFQVQYDNASSIAEQLRTQLQGMKDEFANMKNKKAILIARVEAAKAQKKINKTVSSFGADNAAKGFARMTEKVLEIEAEAEASKELKGLNSSLEDELAALEDSGIDEELAELKARLAKKGE